MRNQGTIIERIKKEEALKETIEVNPPKTRMKNLITKTEIITTEEVINLMKGEKDRLTRVMTGNRVMKIEERNMVMIADLITEIEEGTLRVLNTQDMEDREVKEDKETSEKEKMVATIGTIELRITIPSIRGERINLMKNTTKIRVPAIRATNQIIDSLKEMMMMFLKSNNSMKMFEI